MQMRVLGVACEVCGARARVCVWRPSLPVQDKLEGFASLHGPQFYGLAPNASCVTLVKQPWVVPERYTFGEDTVRPLMAGEELAWRVET